MCLHLGPLHSHRLPSDTPERKELGVGGAAATLSPTHTPLKQDCDHTGHSLWSVLQSPEGNRRGSRSCRASGTKGLTFLGFWKQGGRLEQLSLE